MNKTIALVFSLWLIPIFGCAQNILLRPEPNWFIPPPKVLTNPAWLNTKSLIAKSIADIKERRIASLKRDLAVFNASPNVPESRRQLLLNKINQIEQQAQFLDADSEVFTTQLLHIYTPNAIDTLTKRMVEKLQSGAIEEASDVINRAEYIAHKERILSKTPLKMQDAAFLRDLAYLKAKSALYLFNTEQADFYFKEAIGFLGLNTGLKPNFKYLTDYTQFLLAFNERKKAFENMQQTLGEAQKQQNTEGEAFAYYFLQNHYAEAQKLDLALKTCEQALKSWDTLYLLKKDKSYIRVHAQTYLDMGRILAQVADLNTVRTFAIKAEEQLQNFMHEDTTFLAPYLNSLYRQRLKVYEKTGFYTEGVSFGVQKVKIFQSFKNPHIRLGKIQAALLLHELAEMQERADSIEGAFDFSEKALFLAQESGDEASTVKAHHTFASINRLIYEKTGLTQLRQKGIAQLKTFEELLSKKAHTHPSVKEWLQEIKAYQSFYADFNKAQLALAQDITRLERGIRQCRTVQQTIFYRTKLIEQLLLLEKQFSSPNAYVNQKLQTAYCQQALAQSRLQNYRAIEINAIEALKRDVDNDRLKALLATTQLMLFKKEVAKETYRTVKDQREIFEVLDDFEKQGVKNAEFNWVRTAYLTEKNGL